MKTLDRQGLQAVIIYKFPLSKSFLVNLELSRQ